MFLFLPPQIVKSLVLVRNSLVVSFLVWALFTSFSSVAELQPRGVSLSYGQNSLSNNGNAASAALTIKRKEAHVVSGGMISIKGSLEYGDIDELFDKLDELASSYTPPVEDDSGNSGGDGGDAGDSNDDSNWDNLFEQYLELEDRVDAIERKVIGAAVTVVLIAVEGYGKAELDTELSFVVNENLFGGTLLIGNSLTRSSKVFGLFDRVNFDKEVAKQALQQFNPNEVEDSITTIDLSGGIKLHYNKNTGKTTTTFDNDSLLLIKAASINKTQLSYSHIAINTEFGDLYWGVKPTYFRVGLTNVDVKMGDLTDSELLFDKIQNADYISDTGFDIDLGLVWAAQNYQVGLAVNNTTEQTYLFPELKGNYTRSESIISRLEQHKSATIERKIQIETGIYTDDRSWAVYAYADANETKGIMNDKHQWVSVTGAYSADSWGLSSARLGYSHNFSGTKLSYLNVGITTLKYLNIDLSTTVDTVRLDGTDILRGANIGVGVQFPF